MLNIEKYRNGKQLVWVNVASSFYVLDDFINLDNHLFIRFTRFYPVLKKVIPTKYHPLFESYLGARKNNILLKHDCRKRLPFPAESVDHILCSHFLEHVFPMEAEGILADFYLVLKKGATLHVIVPDLTLQVGTYLNNRENNPANAADIFANETLLSRERRGSLRYRFLEFIGGYGLQHYWVYDYPSMLRRLEKVGFEMVVDNCSPSQKFRANDGSLHVLVRKS